MPSTSANDFKQWTKDNMGWGFAAATAFTWVATALAVRMFCMKTHNDAINPEAFIKDACLLPHKSPENICVEGMNWGFARTSGLSANSKFPNITVAQTERACPDCTDEPQKALWLASMLEAASASLALMTSQEEHHNHMDEHVNKMWGTLFITSIICLMLYQVLVYAMKSKKFYQQEAATQIMTPMIIALLIAVLHALIICAQTPKNSLSEPSSYQKLTSAKDTSCALELGSSNVTACITASIKGANHAKDLTLQCNANDPFPNYINPYKNQSEWCATQCNGWQSGFYQFIAMAYMNQCVEQHNNVSLPVWGTFVMLVAIALFLPPKELDWHASARNKIRSLFKPGHSGQAGNGEGSLEEESLLSGGNNTGTGFTKP